MRKVLPFLNTFQQYTTKTRGAIQARCVPNHSRQALNENGLISLTFNIYEKFFGSLPMHNMD